MSSATPVSLSQLFVRSLLLSATTVGGGFVILSVMEKNYVKKLGWFDREEMTDIASLAQSAPGAVAVNAALLVGYRLRGLVGAIVSLFGCILPPFVIMCVLGALYSYVRHSPVVEFLLPFVRLVLGLLLCKIALDLCRRNLTSLSTRLVYAVALVGMVFFRLSGIWFLLGTGLSTILLSMGKHKEG